MELYDTGGVGGPELHVIIAPFPFEQWKWSYCL